MKTLTTALQQKIASGVIPTMTGTVTQADGSALTLTGADFMENTFAFAEATTNEGSFDIGCAIIGSFGFALNNFDGVFDSFDFTNAYIDPVLDFGDGDTLPMKRYYFAKHKTAGKAIRCESYDGMKFLDEYVVNLTYPITCAAAVAQIATECGVTLATASFPNSTYTLTEEVSEVTARTLLAYIAQVCGCFAIFRNDGLHLEWYPTTASGTVQTTFSAPNVGTSDITITGVMVYPFGKTDEPAQLGTDDYMIVIENNPFITPTNSAAIAANLWANLNGMTFRAGSVDILSNPAMEAGDMMSVVIGGSTITMLSTTVMYKKMLRQSLQCDAVAEEEADIRTGSAITAGDLAKILTVNGINADWINTGALTAVDGQGNIVFKIDASNKTLQWNTEYSQLESDGMVTFYSDNSSSNDTGLLVRNYNIKDSESTDAYRNMWSLVGAGWFSMGSAGYPRTADFRIATSPYGQTLSLSNMYAGFRVSLSSTDAQDDQIVQLWGLTSFNLDADVVHINEGTVIQGQYNNNTYLTLDTSAIVVSSDKTINGADNLNLALDTNAATGTTDGDLYAAINSAGWVSDVIV